MFVISLKQLLLCSVVFAALLQGVHGSCQFPLTHQVLQNICDWSNWLPWDCKCCGSDVVDQRMAKRQRGICCYNPHQPLKDCLSQCGYLSTDDTEYGTCRSTCSHKSGLTICPSSIPTTLSTTESTTPTTTLVTTGKTSTTTQTTILTTKSTTRTKTQATPSTRPSTKSSTILSTQPTSLRAQTSTASNHSSNTTGTIYTLPILISAICVTVLASCLLACCILFLLKNKNRRNRVDSTKRKVQSSTDNMYYYDNTKEDGVGASVDNTYYYNNPKKGDLESPNMYFYNRSEEDGLDAPKANLYKNTRPEIGDFDDTPDDNLYQFNRSGKDGPNVPGDSTYYYTK